MALASRAAWTARSSQRRASACSSSDVQARAATRRIWSLASGSHCPRYACERASIDRASCIRPSIASVSAWMTSAGTVTESGRSVSSSMACRAASDAIRWCPSIALVRAAWARIIADQMGSIAWIRSASLSSRSRPAIGWPDHIWMRHLRCCASVRRRQSSVCSSTWSRSGSPAWTLPAFWLRSAAFSSRLARPSPGPLSRADRSTMSMAVE